MRTKQLLLVGLLVGYSVQAMGCIGLAGATTTTRYTVTHRQYVKKPQPKPVYVYKKPQWVKPEYESGVLSDYAMADNDDSYGNYYNNDDGYQGDAYESNDDVDDCSAFYDKYGYKVCKY